jgi:hypothetical protein
MMSSPWVLQLASLKVAKTGTACMAGAMASIERIAVVKYMLGCALLPVKEFNAVE